LRLRELPGERLLLGAAIIREWQEDNLGFDDNSGMSHHIQDLEGGLFEIDTKTLRWKKLGSRAKELTDFYVKRIYFDDRDRKAYICTNGGVTILSLPDYEIAGRITVSDGLPSNKVEDCVRIGEKLYMACELGDEDGGLAVKDLKTGLIQRLSMSDGLKCDKIKRLRADGTDLHILYGTIYGVRAYNTPQDDSIQAKGADDRVRTFTSSILDTKTDELRSGNEVLPAPRPPDDKKQLPYLGGAVLCDVTHAGKRLIGGTHGLVIVRPGVDVENRMQFPLEPVKPVLSLQQKQLAEAAKVSIPRSISLEELKTFLKHQNPYVKANALAAAMVPVQGGNAEYTPVVGKCVADPCDRVRATAVWLLSRAKDDAAIEPLRLALGDRDPYIRAVAALGLADHGVLAPLSHFEEMLKQRDHYGNYPYGAASSVGVEAGRERIYSALAPHADRAVLELMMKYPLTADDYEPRQKILARIGATLREHPDAAEVLLKAYDDDRHSWGQVRFAQAVLGHAGKPMLPILYKALTSKDRVIRSNVAQACGAMGERSSIPRLTKSLDLESGYSRASIVWALGELKAKEALPQLAKLYVDARNDERRRRGSGFRMAQSQAAIRAHYDSFSNLDALGGEWNELKQTAQPKPVAPRRNEELLSPEGILAAVRKIGPAASQPFYRSIAGEKDIDARLEAAQRLADCGRDDVKENVQILRNLLADDNERIRMAAATSLLILGKQISRQPILQWLDSPHEWQKRAVLQQLARVKDADKLSFARSRIQAIAADSKVDRYTRQAAQKVVRNLFQ